MRGPNSNLTSEEAARRLGVSGKALRVYEAHGLVTPGRTQAGWRVYGPEQIACLHQVLALKSFGLPLGRIAELLSGRLADLAAFLALHEDVLRRQQSEVAHALGLVSAARARLAQSGSLSPDDLIELTRKTVMTNIRNETVAAAYEAIAAKHLTPADQAVLDANGFRGMGEADSDWASLNAEAARLMPTAAPNSPEAMDLARRWMTKVFQGTGGDAALTRKMKAVARETFQQPAFQAHEPSATAIMDYVASCYGAAIAAGIMPKPE